MPEFSDYRRPLGRALNDLGVYPVNAATSSTVTSGLLADFTPDASEHRYDGAYVYVASGASVGTQRRVMPGGFDPSTGTLTVETGWVAPAPDDAFEITRLFPVVEQIPNEDASYRALINRASAKVWAPDRIPLVFAGTASASIVSYPWLDRPERLFGVLEAAARTGFPPVDAGWRGVRLIFDGPTPVLQLARPYTGTLLLDVRRPGNTLISGLELEGIVVEGNTALPSVEDVLSGALAEAYFVLMNRSPGRPGFGNYSEKYERQLAQFEARYYFDQSQKAPARPSAEVAA